MTLCRAMNITFSEDYRIRNETYSAFPKIGTAPIPRVRRLQGDLGLGRYMG